MQPLRQSTSDPHAFILRQGWASLDFREEEEEAERLEKLWKGLEREIVSVMEATERLHKSHEFELYELTAKSPEMFDSTVAKQIESLEAEVAELQTEANQLAEKIEEWTGRPASNL